MSAKNSRGRGGLKLVGEDDEVLFYARQVAAAGGPVLVLGCASGKVAWALGERGVAVLGVDPSPGMMALAEERRSAVSTEVSARVRFLTADLRALRLSERFAVV